MIEQRNGARLVVGASRGIGLALVAAQLQNPAVGLVIATSRPDSAAHGLEQLQEAHGERLLRLKLDVTDENSVGALGSAIRSIEGGVDIAIHAAGLLHDGELQPEKSLADCQAENLKRLFETNSIGPLLVARTLFPAQGRRRRFTFAVLSAMVGSIGDNRLGGWYGYRASKAALNQFLKSLSIECRHRYPSATVLAVHPGTTDTALSRPFQSRVAPENLATPDATAARILRLVGNAGAAQHGQFLHWDGSEIPW
jgi:NAD(P)-dependent dehydrogenase (short-subunit alcohol dehydrogenase family)